MTALNQCVAPAPAASEPLQLLRQAVRPDDEGKPDRHVTKSSELDRLADLDDENGRRDGAADRRDRLARSRGRGRRQVSGVAGSTK